MSYTIEYNAKAFKIEKGTKVNAGRGKIAHDLYEDEIILFHKIGCNNIHPRPKTWNHLVSGWNYRVIQQVCEVAGTCEGGGYKMYNGDTTPESYLARWRKKIANAKILSPESLIDDTGIYAFEIFYRDEKLSDYDRKELSEALDKYGEATTWLDMQKITIPFKELEDFWNFQYALSYASFGSCQSIQNV